MKVNNGETVGPSRDDENPDRNGNDREDKSRAHNPIGLSGFPPAGFGAQACHLRVTQTEAETRKAPGCRSLSAFRL